MRGIEQHGNELQGKGEARNRSAMEKLVKVQRRTDPQRRGLVRRCFELQRQRVELPGVVQKTLAMVANGEAMICCV